MNHLSQWQRGTGPDDDDVDGLRFVYASSTAVVIVILLRDATLADIVRSS
jgi:hypothetical protein